MQNSSFEVFKTHVIKDIPHLAKATSLLWTIDDDGLDVDLSPGYFNIQMRGILTKEKSIRINAIEFESPIVSTLSSNQATDKYSSTDDKQPKQNIRAHARKKLDLPERDNSRLGFVFGGESDVDSDNEDTKENETRIIMPLERQATKWKQTVDKISLELEEGTRKLRKFDERIGRASTQNEGS